MKKSVILISILAFMSISCTVTEKDMKKWEREANVNSLIEALKDNNWWVRENSARILGGMKSRQAVSPLTNLLEDKDWRVRRAAADALGNIGVEDPVDELAELLKDKERAVNKTAAQALIRIGKVSVAPLISMLKHENIHTRQSAATVLSAVRWQPKNDEDRAWLLVGKLQCAQAANLGKIALKPLLLTLKQGDTPARAKAALALGKITDVRTAVKPLLNALNDEKSVRINAAKSLGRIGDQRAVEPLIQLLKEKDILIKQTVIHILGSFRDSRAVEPIIRVLEGDDDALLSQFAADALGELGYKRAVPSLITALKNKNPWIRRSVIEALAKLGDKQAIKYIKYRLEDKDEDVRNAAAEALKKLESMP